MFARLGVVALVVAAIASIADIVRPNQSEICLRSAAHRLAENNLQQAARCISRAIAAEPSNVETYLGAVTLYRITGHHREEAALAELMISRAESKAGFPSLGRKERASLYAEAAYAHWSAGNLKMARRRYETAYKLTPTDPLLNNNLGYFYADTGLDLRRALQLTQAAVDADPHSGIFLDSLGWALFKTGKPGKALHFLRRAAELEPDSAEIRFHLGAAYARLGNAQSATVELKKALLLDGSLTDARLLLRNLKPQ